MSENRAPSERYARMARELIDPEPALAHVRDSGAAIAYLASDHAKRSHGRAACGECERVPARWR